MVNWKIEIGLPSGEKNNKTKFFDLADHNVVIFKSDRLNSTHPLITAHYTSPLNSNRILISIVTQCNLYIMMTVPYIAPPPGPLS